LPIRFQFSSRQDAIAESGFGHGWWFPVLESTATKVSERQIRVFLFTGGHLNLVKGPSEDKNQENYFTPDHNWLGVADESGRFTLTSADKLWKMGFQHGKLLEVKFPDGESLRWHYKGDDVTKVTSSELGDLVDVRRNERNLISKVFFKGAPEVAVDYDSFPLMIELLGAKVVSQLEPSASAFKMNGGERVMKCEWGVGEDGLMEMSIEDTIRDFVWSENDLKWDIGTGNVISDGESLYKIAFERHLKNGRSLSVERVDPNGDVIDSWAHDARSMTTEVSSGSGHTILTTAIGVPGPSFGKIRKRQVVNGESRDILRAYA